MTNATKKRISSIVAAYKQLFPDEYETAALNNKVRSQLQVTDWGEFHGGIGLGRELFRWPENLNIALQQKLSEEQWEELMSDKGVIWFQRTFPEWTPNRKHE